MLQKDMCRNHKNYIKNIFEKTPYLDKFNEPDAKKAYKIYF